TSVLPWLSLLSHLPPPLLSLLPLHDALPISLVILDLFPVTQGHALVVPRQHCASIQALPAENTEHLLHLVRLTMAAQEQEDATITAQNLLINDRPDANQHIPHVHWHVIPRRKGDHLKS